MDGFVLLSAWLAGMLGATWLGYDRGRWGAGLLLGICLGPLGLVAAGLMPPSYAWQAERDYRLSNYLESLRRRDQKVAAQRRRSRAEFESWVTDIEKQVKSEDLRLAEGLEELATQIDQSQGNGEACDEPPALHPWSGWLKEKAERVRNSSTARQEI